MNVAIDSIKKKGRVSCISGSCGNAPQYRKTAASAPPAVSIVVPCRNEKNYIEACLRSIFRQAEAPGGFEVIVADGISDDGTREILKRLSDNYPQLSVVDNPQRFVSAALNAAIRAARGGIIIRMDTHTR